MWLNYNLFFLNKFFYKSAYTYKFSIIVKLKNIYPLLCTIDYNDKKIKHKINGIYKKLLIYVQKIINKFIYFQWLSVKHKKCLHIL